jgi:hypothetical protein
MEMCARKCCVLLPRIPQEWDHGIEDGGLSPGVGAKMLSFSHKCLHEYIYYIKIRLCVHHNDEEEEGGDREGGGGWRYTRKKVPELHSPITRCRIHKIAKPINPAPRPPLQ